MAVSYSQDLRDRVLAAYDRGMRTKQIALVSCVKMKQPYPCAVREMYVSPLFMKSRTYAEVHADHWFILSAKYGLVEPDEVIAPYEKTLNNAGVSERREWARRVHAQLESRGVLQQGVSFVWLAGAKYQESLRKLLGDFDHHDPLAGLRMGERLARLSKPM